MPLLRKPHRPCIVVHCRVGSSEKLAALCDFAWNEGLDALFDKSTLWRLWQSGRSFVVVAEYFEEWDIACGRVVQGLENRRILEKNLFLSPVVSA
jgi:GH24 family phage-related lysozyme (muramidase)